MFEVRGRNSKEVLKNGDTSGTTNSSYPNPHLQILKGKLLASSSYLLHDWQAFDSLSSDKKEGVPGFHRTCETNLECKILSYKNL